jgi:hypothetical protein
MHNLADFFLMQASISVMHARKIKRTIDLQYFDALCSAFDFYANIVIFSINKRYPVIEKGGAKLISFFSLCIKNYEQRIAVLFRLSCHGNYALALSEMTALFNELEALTNSALNTPKSLQGLGQT